MNKKTLKNLKLSCLSVIFGLFLVTSGASAGDVSGTQIDYVRVAGSVLNIVVKDAVNSRPACSTHATNGRSFAIDLSTLGAQEIARLATAAHLAGRKVKIVGSGTCTVQSNKENLTDFYLLSN